jgi:hypothetical protein
MEALAAPLIPLTLISAIADDGIKNHHQSAQPRRMSTNNTIKPTPSRACLLFIPLYPHHTHPRRHVTQTNGNRRELEDRLEQSHILRVGRHATSEANPHSTRFSHVHLGDVCSTNRTRISASYASKEQCDQAQRPRLEWERERRGEWRDQHPSRRSMSVSLSVD